MPPLIGAGRVCGDPAVDVVVVGVSVVVDIVSVVDVTVVKGRDAVGGWILDSEGSVDMSTNDT
jgi:hypothetical protein